MIQANVEDAKALTDTFVEVEACQELYQTAVSDGNYTSQAYKGILEQNMTALKIHKVKWRNILEFRIYQHSGAQIAVNQYTGDASLELDDEHISKITNNLVEKQTLLTDCIIDLIHSSGHEELSMQDISYNYWDGQLMVQLNSEQLFKII